MMTKLDMLPVQFDQLIGYNRMLPNGFIVDSKGRLYVNGVEVAREIFDPADFMRRYADEEVCKWIKKVLLEAHAAAKDQIKDEHVKELDSMRTLMNHSTGKTSSFRRAMQ